MSTVSDDPRRLTQLAPDEDPHRVAALIRAAKAAPEDEMPRLRWRLRASLRQRAKSPRRFLRVALVVVGVFLTGGMVGAMVRPFWEHKPTGPTPALEPPAKSKPQPARKKSIRVPAESPEPVASMETDAVEDKLVAAPLANPRAPMRLARRAPVPSAPDLPPSPAATAVPAPPSPTAVEQAMLGDVLKALRSQHNPRAALALLDEHGKRFPDTALAPEAAMFRAEALLNLGRKAEALSALDGLSLASMPNGDERLVLRGELRAAAGRWREARADFDSSISTTASAGLAGKTHDLMERALWGRASVRSHLGDETGARADLTLYLRSFPSGRFAAQTAALLRGSP